MVSSFNHLTIVHPSLHFVGGAERLMTDLALGLADAGIQVEVVTGMCHDYWRSELSRKAGVSVKELGHAATGNLSFWLNVKGFAKALAKLINPETDVVFTSNFPSSLVANSFSRRCEARVVHYIHDAPIVLHDKEGIEVLPLRFRLFYRFVSALYAKYDIEAIQAGDLILASSQLSKRVNSKVYEVDESLIQVVYPGVNIGRMTPSVVVPSLISEHVEKGVQVIFIPKGAQFWRKPEVCLRALKRLRAMCLVAVFTGGAGYEVSSLLRHAKALGIADKVLWVRELPQSEINAMYFHSALVVSIAKRQGFGLIPLEALVCGVPPVISRSSGVSEVLRDGVDALCVDEGDSEQLADAIETLVLDPETRRKIVASGKQKVLADFTSVRFVKDIIANVSKLAS
jgi:glycosyltransferase involved in cell wall biosynthesis